MNAFAQTFRALRYRNYRVFFIGQSVSLVGTWMQQVAVGWLVYRLTGSAFWLGVAGFASQIPTFFVTPFAGVLADRYEQRRLLIITQVLEMMQAFALAFLVFQGTAELWNIILLCVLFGAIQAFDIPVRQSFLIQLIDKKDDLSNAIALNSSMFHGARLVGPCLAGLLIAAEGEGICLLINAFSFIAVLVALFSLRLVPREAGSSVHGVLHDLKEGMAYAWKCVPIRALLLLIALLSFVGMPYAVLMPVFAKEILSGGPSTLGFLVGASGFGALAGSFYLASRQSVRGLGGVIGLTAAAFGAALCGFSLSTMLWASLSLMFCVGFSMLVMMASGNTVLQTLVDDDKRGRIMSLFTLSFLGMIPLGSLVAGGVASVFGAPATVLIGGFVCMAGALAFAVYLPVWREMVRPIYRTKGIIPPQITPVN